MYHNNISVRPTGIAVNFSGKEVPIYQVTAAPLPQIASTKNVSPAFYGELPVFEPISTAAVKTKTLDSKKYIRAVSRANRNYSQHGRKKRFEPTILRRAIKKMEKQILKDDRQLDGHQFIGGFRACGPGTVNTHVRGGVSVSAILAKYNF